MLSLTGETRCFSQHQFLSTYWWSPSVSYSGLGYVLASSMAHVTGDWHWAFRVSSSLPLVSLSHLLWNFGWGLDWCAHGAEVSSGGDSCSCWDKCSVSAWLLWNEEDIGELKLQPGHVLMFLSPQDTLGMVVQQSFMAASSVLGFVIRALHVVFSWIPLKSEEATLCLYDGEGTFIVLPPKPPKITQIPSSSLWLWSTKSHQFLSTLTILWYAILYLSLSGCGVFATRKNNTLDLTSFVSTGHSLHGRFSSGSSDSAGPSQDPEKDRGTQSTEHSWLFTSSSRKTWCTGSCQDFLVSRCHITWQEVSDSSNNWKMPILVLEVQLSNPTQLLCTTCCRQGDWNGSDKIFLPPFYRNSMKEIENCFCFVLFPYREGEGGKAVLAERSCLNPVLLSTKFPLLSYFACRCRLLHFAGVTSSVILSARGKSDQRA